MLPGSTKLALRLCCKQLKWEIDHLVGLTIKVYGSNNVFEKSKRSEWVKEIRIRNLTISSHKNTRQMKNLEVHSAWTSVLKDGEFSNLNRLSLSTITCKRILTWGAYNIGVRAAI